MVTGVGMNRDINSNNPQNILKYAFFSVKITQWISFHWHLLYGFWSQGIVDLGPSHY